MDHVYRDTTHNRNTGSNRMLQHVPSVPILTVIDRNIPDQKFISENPRERKCTRTERLIIIVQNSLRIYRQSDFRSFTNLFKAQPVDCC